MRAGLYYGPPDILRRSRLQLRVHRFTVNHFRLLLSIAAGIATFFLAPVHGPTILRVLVAWNCGVALFLLLIYLWMRSLSANQVSSRFIEEDESAPVIMVAVTAAACLSLVAIVMLLSNIKQLPDPARAARFLLAAVTVVNSWILVPTMFALHYADLFYSAAATNRPLEFPRTTMPVFWDFAYFSFTISAAAQTSDVITLHSTIRRTVLVHTVIAFFFNASILGFAVNVTAGLFAAN